ncbi:tripartite tricarboxylate transporter substrate-binding protein [Achromobacter mucicolens]|uniref:tripartite tricarboxylate transporter substrate-binding protein n=1 Tax=Achromobacter mucicolens TaxID=1389922 RepID=UPI00244ABACE|nr:tripartite tricarboxylate transporter substrate-binding protein [Achromobacter mucicolens]MDH0091781.1 tripartite tricarboxylate transporter substrate-binding protein [Achromobacter mucicolens]
MTSGPKFFAPSNTPEPIVQTLNAAFSRVMAKPEIQARFKELGVKVSPPTSPAAFGQFVTSSDAQWQKLIEEAKIPWQ